MSSNQVTAKQAVAANLKVDPSGVTSPVSAASLPLPSGAATAALQAGGLPAALGSGGGLKVDGSGTALPVSGTLTGVTTVAAVTAITNALPAGTNAIGKLAANSGVDIGDVDITSSALPTGASTAAKQPALGTAGTASADVITVQGVASGVPLFSGIRQINISQTPTVSTSPAYTAADALGGLLTFANAARTSAGSGIVQAVTVMCKTAALVPALELVLFNQTFTAVTDNANFNPSDGDMANCIGVIPIAAWADYGLNSIATRFALAFPFTLTGTSLFGQLVTRTAFTAAGTTDFIIGIQILYAD